MAPFVFLGWPQPEFHFMGLTISLYGVTISTYGANHTPPPPAHLEKLSRTSAGASTGNASVAGTAARHDGSASGAAGGRRIVDGFYGVGGTMVDIAIFGEGRRKAT